MTNTPPEGISAEDYEAIEAAVMETARGRWFLSEFARRNRIEETRQMLGAIARLEQVVLEQKALPADPSVRLLVQRLKEISQQLDGLADEMRAAGNDEICARIEAQARAVSGLLRLNGPASAPSGRRDHDSFDSARPSNVIGSRDLERDLRERLVAPRPALAAVERAAPAAVAPSSGQDRRLAALARLDRLPLAEKLALFA